MSTQKNRPVLFELVKNRPSSGATSWRAPLPAKLQARQRVAEGEQPPPAGVTPIRVTAERPSWEVLIPRVSYEAAGGQIRVGMNAAAAIAIGVVLVVLLFAAFQFGRSFAASPAAPNNGPKPATGPTTAEKSNVATPPSTGDTGKVHTPNRPADEPEQRPSGVVPPTRRDNVNPRPDSADAEKPQPEKTPSSTNAEAPKVSAEPPGTTFELKKGYHYLVIQHFRKTDMETADAAARFLIANGVPCAVQNMKADIRVLATDTFLIANQKEPIRKEQQDRANDLIRKVKQLGKEFAKTHGYAFDQCELRELK